MENKTKMDGFEKVITFSIIGIWLLGVYHSHWWVTGFIGIMVLITIIGAIRTK